MEWILAMQAQCPLLLTGQSPPALIQCVMVWCTVQCQHVSCTAKVICVLLFFSWEKLTFIWPLMSAACQPTCASWWWCWCLLRGGWPALWSSSWVLCLQALGSVKLLWTPHWVPEFVLLQVYHPIWVGVAHALGPLQWTNNSTDLLDVK